MNEVLRERLIEAARARQFISYSDLSAAINLSMTDTAGTHALNVMLEEIAEHELENNRPLLVAIIVNANDNMPGTGLFSYAKRKGLLKPAPKTNDKLEFFVREAKRVHDFWQNQPA